MLEQGQVQPPELLEQLRAVGHHSRVTQVLHRAALAQRLQLRVLLQVALQLAPRLQRVKQRRKLAGQGDVQLRGLQLRQLPHLRQGGLLAGHPLCLVQHAVCVLGAQALEVIKARHVHRVRGGVQQAQHLAVKGQGQVLLGRGSQGRRARLDHRGRLQLLGQLACLQQHPGLRLQLRGGGGRVHEVQHALRHVQLPLRAHAHHQHTQARPVRLRQVQRLVQHQAVIEQLRLEVVGR
mmetsp:Transcript_37554/g.94808  ORF Transcript_37554/g.94808 Transcript_37554/m.94808 type:complete len:236 (-) Transcript_37554:456-1163(-)